MLLARRRAEEMTPVIPAGVDVYVAPDAMMEQIIGFKFHSGVIACGVRKGPVSLDQFIAEHTARLTLVICPETANTENMGAMIRITSALGGDGMLLGPQCCDPFFRQSVRVSMGTIFSLPIIRSADLAADLEELRDRWGVVLAATVLEAGAEPLASVTHPEDGWRCFFGNEAQGAGRKMDARFAQRRVTIPMHQGTDSLNVAVSAGIVLYQLGR